VEDCSEVCLVDSTFLLPLEADRVEDRVEADLSSCSETGPDLDDLDVLTELVPV
jgi:hypothetical protein